ncbi:hypothetical protein [Curvibacter lanceolatus]|uniref:hypothetical protein n=1 Tax=Curvibacter lanceolatus TaxID=86182 RepID=UPI0004CE7755|nr:hypothetical protein [Curvibacter lanceolatus]
MSPARISVLPMRCIALLGLSLLMSAHTLAQTTPTGRIEGTAWQHTPASLAASVARAALVLPERATGGARYTGAFSARPATQGQAVPVVLFLHGSSGLGLSAIATWQQWLADQGIASLAPDSFALPERVTYQSPISAQDYERIHALRGSEIAPALAALQAQTWADARRIVLAGTSEGAVAVARYAGDGVAARMVFSWSCEANYFVQAPRNAFAPGQPVLNLISSTDPYFSRSNPWLGAAEAQGHCATALKDNPRASVLLIPNAPHTLLNWPAAQDAVAGFLRRALAERPAP